MADAKAFRDLQMRRKDKMRKNKDKGGLFKNATSLGQLSLSGAPYVRQLSQFSHPPGHSSKLERRSC